MAKSFEPTFFSKVDPKQGPLEARLKARAAPSMPASRIVLGRVLGPDKTPLTNAVVSVEETVIGDTTHGWPPQGTDPLAVTDEAGEFELRCPVTFDAMHLKVEARGFARRRFNEVRPGQRQDLVVTVGAALTGRVVLNGKPVKNITIGVAQLDRTMGQWLGDFVTGTGLDGRFAFPNLPPDRDYAVYGRMDSLKGVGALPTRTFRVKADGSKNDIGTLQLQPGWCLAGQVRLADGKPLPDHTRLIVGRDTAWDSGNAELPPDGRFSLTNIPGEALTVGVRVKGYRLSVQNASLDRLNPFRLQGRLDSNKTNLTILLEPGADLTSQSVAQEDRPENLPLCGIEAKHVIPGALLLRGRVLDAGNNSPIPQFQVTPGRQRGQGVTWIEWQRYKLASGTNGAFALELSARSGATVLMVEAPGYLPVTTEPLASGQSNCVVRLRKGHGPIGVVQLPDGTPVPNVKVLYLAGNEQANLHASGEVTGYGGTTQLTDAAGAFNFAPRTGQGELLIAGAQGFARQRLASPEASNAVVVLPWSQVHGRLIKHSKPVQQEQVDLEFDAGPWNPGQPHLNLHGAVTDEQGRFTIEHVPAGQLQLTTRVPVGDRGWYGQKQKSFAVRPGESLDLGEIEKAEPPQR